MANYKYTLNKEYPHILRITTPIIHTKNSRPITEGALLRFHRETSDPEFEGDTKGEAASNRSRIQYGI